MSDLNTVGRMLLREMRLREAIAGVALSHAEDCECVVCRAADGDEEAWLQLLEGAP